MAVITRKLSELFEEFLRTWQDKSGSYKYRESIAQLAATGDKSVVVTTRTSFSSTPTLERGCSHSPTSR